MTFKTRNYKINNNWGNFLERKVNIYYIVGVFFSFFNVLWKHFFFFIKDDEHITQYLLDNLKSTNKIKYKSLNVGKQTEKNNVIILDFRI